MFVIAAIVDHDKLYNEFYKEWEQCGGTTKITEHDLCKFEPAELLGYYIQWGLNEKSDETNKLVQVKKEEPEWAKKMWADVALKHHYMRSPHHPEYYKGENMKKVDLCESVFDMLACHLQRTLRDEKEVSVVDLMLIPPKFLVRYTEHDRKVVIRLLHLFSFSLDKIILKTSTMNTFDQTALQDSYDNSYCWIQDELEKSLEKISDREITMISNFEKFCKDDSKTTMWEEFINGNWWKPLEDDI